MFRFLFKGTPYGRVHCLRLDATPPRVPPSARPSSFTKAKDAGPTLRPLQLQGRGRVGSLGPAGGLCMLLGAGKSPVPLQSLRTLALTGLSQHVSIIPARREQLLRPSSPPTLPTTVQACSVRLPFLQQPGFLAALCPKCVTSEHNANPRGSYPVRTGSSAEGWPVACSEVRLFFLYTCS